MNVARWEYKVVPVRSAWRPFVRTDFDALLGETLNREGAQGWELVVMQWLGTQLSVVMKRPR